MYIKLGKFKNKKIDTEAFYNGKKQIYRPTTARVKDAIFNLLMHSFPNLLQNGNILDICCGSGSFGFYALSLGASFVTFVDNNPGIVSIVRKNAQSLKLNPNEYSIILLDAINLRQHENYYKKFEIAYIDPPYHQSKIITQIINNLITNEYFSDEALIICEISKKFKIEEIKLDEINCTIKILDVRIYSNTKVILFKFNRI